MPVMTEVIASGFRRSAERLSLAGVTDSALEARLLVEHVIDRDRAWVLAHPEVALSADQEGRLADLVDRRLRGEPIPYLLSRREFYGMDFYVDSRVLIPRPETEVLVDEILQVTAATSAGIRIIDVGTGSGAIALALAAHLPEARVTGVDCSADALEVAKLNAYRLGVIDRVTLIQGNLLSWTREPVDIVVANLPYIPKERLPKLPSGVLEYEPTLALDGGVGGLELNLNLIRQIAGRVKSGGHVFLECEPFQISDLSLAAQSSVTGATVCALLDGFGHERFIHVILP
jgi:release factor glutamine methyltransferase